MPPCGHAITVANHRVSTASAGEYAAAMPSCWMWLAWEGGAKRLTLLPFVDNFYSSYFCVVHSRRECQHQLALAVRTQTVECADYRAKRLGGNLRDIEIAQQRHAVAG